MLGDCLWSKDNELTGSPEGYEPCMGVGLQRNTRADAIVVARRAGEQGLVLLVEQHLALVQEIEMLATLFAAARVVLIAVHDAGLHTKSRQSAPFAAAHHTDTHVTLVQDIELVAAFFATARVVLVAT